jgi:hypothetical protein
LKSRDRALASWPGAANADEDGEQGHQAQRGDSDLEDRYEERAELQRQGAGLGYQLADGGMECRWHDPGQKGGQERRSQRLEPADTPDETDDRQQSDQQSAGATSEHGNTSIHLAHCRWRYESNLPAPAEPAVGQSKGLLKDE